MNQIARQALALPVTGRVLEFAPVLEEGPSDGHGRQWRQVLKSGDALPERQTLGRNDVTGFEEIVSSSTHLGCHVDAPGARIAQGRAGGGRPYAEYFGDAGLRDLGAELLAPVVARGVLVEAPGGRLEDSGIEVGDGDVVLIRTGGTIPPAPALRDLARRGAALIGIDAEGCELDAGCPVVSHLLLDELASVASGPFLFVMAPIRGAGSTAAPVSPLAIL